MSSGTKRHHKKRDRCELASKVPPRRLRSSAGWRFALAALVLCALVLIAYGNSGGNGFVWDDHEQIVMNPALSAETPLASLFTADVRFANRSLSIRTAAYRPLQMLTYRMVIVLAGVSPAAFHVSSLVLAVGGTLAAFAVFLLLTGKMAPAFVAAALFAVYPLHTEAVDWIAASPELGCGLFFLAAFALFLAGRPRSDRAERSSLSRWRILLFSLLTYAMALLWKETAAIFPVLIGVYTWVVETGNGSRVRSALSASLPYWTVLGIYLVLRTRVLGSLATGQRSWALNPFQFLLTALHLMMAYWAKLVFPFQLNAYYVFSPVRSVLDPRAIAAIIFALCTLAGFIYLLRRAPVCAFAVLWVWITLLPALDVNAVGRNVFAERYLYLPSVGFCLLVASGMFSLTSHAPVRFRKPVGIGLFVVVASGLMAETIARNPVWKDDNTLFSETLHRAPDAPFVRYMVATAQSADPSESAAAEQNYLRAIALAQQQIPPDRFDLVKAYEGVAWLYADRSDYPRALEMLTRVREVAPTSTEADDEEGLVLARAGRWKEAEPLLNKSFAARPDLDNVLSALGLLEWQYHHDLNTAVERFSKALAVHSQDDDFRASVHSNLGAVYGERGDFTSAIEQFRLAVNISPGNVEYHTNLANALGAAGRYDEARSEAEAALRIDPSYPAALAVLQNLKIK
jgi:protein O-mannosyl-transferase